MLRIVITIFFINTTADLEPFNQAVTWMNKQTGIEFILIAEEVLTDLEQPEHIWVYESLAAYEGTWSGARVESYAEQTKKQYDSDYAFLIFVPAIEGSKAYAYPYSYAVVYSNRQHKEATIAHEIGHLLGAFHSAFLPSLMHSQFYYPGYLQGILAVDSRIQMNLPIHKIYLPITLN